MLQRAYCKCKCTHLRSPADIGLAIALITFIVSRYTYFCSEWSVSIGDVFHCQFCHIQIQANHPFHQLTKNCQPKNPLHMSNQEFICFLRLAYDVAFHGLRHRPSVVFSTFYRQLLANSCPVFEVGLFLPRSQTISAPKLDHFCPKVSAFLTKIR